MNIWLVNPFDPLPGDPEQEGRYATLATMLAQRGHAIAWWTSSFSHRFKRPVDQAALTARCRPRGIESHFLSAPPYQKNVSVARVWNHYALMKAFHRAAARSRSRPDVVIASSPPPGLAMTAVTTAHTLGARAILDVQDLWPETFTRLLPGPLRPLGATALWPMHWAAQKAARRADALVGVADAYVQRALELSHRADQRTAMIPLGIDLAVFDAAASRGKQPELTKPPGDIWLAYTGSLSRSYDPLTILQAAEYFRNNPTGRRLRFFITGRGELLSAAQRQVESRGLNNVTLSGFLDFDAWAHLLSQCDIAFNASFPDAMIFLPNKIFYYLAAGAAVLNTIPGQCSRLVKDGACGADYAAGDAAGCVGAIRRLLEMPPRLADMRRAARRLAERVYDRRILYQPYVELIESL